MNMTYAAIIYNNFNIITRVEERANAALAERAGLFYTNQLRNGWFKITNNQEEINLYKALINA